MTFSDAGQELKLAHSFRTALRAMSIALTLLFGLVAWILAAPGESVPLSSFLLGVGVSLGSLELLAFFAWRLLVSVLPGNEQKRFLRTPADLLFLVVPLAFILGAVFHLKTGGLRLSPLGLTLGFSVLPTTALGAAIVWNFRKKI